MGCKGAEAPSRAYTIGVVVAKRLLAVLVAAALVVGAVVVRGRIDATSASGPRGTAAPDIISVACAEDLRVVCDELDVDPSFEVVPAPVEQTVAAIASEPVPSFDVWLTFSPWPELAGQRRDAAQRATVTGEASPVLASSPVVVVARQDRLRVLASWCGGSLTWECIGEAAGSQWRELGGESAWGTVKVGHASPETSATGLLTLAQAAAGYLGTAGFGSRALEDPSFFAWFADLVGAVRPAGPSGPLQQMITQPGSYDLVGALGVDADEALTFPQAAGLIAVDPGPAMAAQVVAVGIGDAGPAATAALEERARQHLQAAGWRADTTAPPASPDDTGTTAVGVRPAGVPSAGALEALRRLWLEVRQ